MAVRLKLVVVAHVAAYFRALAQGDGDVFLLATRAKRAIFTLTNHKTSIAGYFGQHRSLTIAAMASTTGVTIVFGEILVAAIGERCATNGVHAMRPVECDTKRARCMAGITFDNVARVTLQLRGGDVVVSERIGVWPDRMRAAVTAFAHDAIVTLLLTIFVTAEAIETVVFSEARSRCGEWRGTCIPWRPGLQ